MDDEQLQQLAAAQCDREQQLHSGVAATPESMTAVKLTPGLSIFLTIFAKAFGKYAVRPVLGLLGHVIGVDAVKAEAKTWIDNNGG